MGLITAILMFLGIQMPVQPPTVASPTAISAPTTIAMPLTSAAGLEGKLVFVSNRDGDYEIYTMNADGTDVVKLTDDKANDWYPSWSPDGKSILYTSQPSQPDKTYNQIFRMNADGSGRLQLTTDPAEHLDPTWSPDGKRIAFVFASATDGNREIYVMDADGSNAVNLTNDPADDRAPTFSPDGKQIAFYSNRDLPDKRPALGDIYVMDADGSHQTRITHDGASIEPVWSPDGKHIAITTVRKGMENHQIWLIAPDGSNPTPLMNSIANDTSDAWSPDGKYVVILHVFARGGDVYKTGYLMGVLSMDGAERIQLTDDSSDNLLPSWTR
jgi:Tol biopolymer transport system component